MSKRKSRRRRNVSVWQKRDIIKRLKAELERSGVVPEVIEQAQIVFRIIIGK